MKVLRVEHPETGLGPYTHGGMSGPGLRYLSHCYSKISQPDPDADGIKGHYGMHYGFKDLEQLHDWFSLRVLHALVHRTQFQVVEYEVPEKYVLFGGHQVAFDKEHAVKVGVVVY